ncbi:hypothetical protein ACUN0C_08885 [Faunimonas sp. B44]|uniref:hypothetical protein n=1 Tax=Faunimonas sp. B44 TaxID=3461493 RepID=UPI0040448AFC
MIRTAAAVALAAGLLAACQSVQPRSAMDGRWASADGVFVATFDSGKFTSRFTKTNEVLAQGTYAGDAGNRIAMNWLSVATKQQRSATCSFTGPNTVSCQQTGGGAFQLNRAA